MEKCSESESESDSSDLSWPKFPLSDQGGKGGGGSLSERYVKLADLSSDLVIASEDQAQRTKEYHGDRIEKGKGKRQRAWERLTPIESAAVRFGLEKILFSSERIEDYRVGTSRYGIPNMSL